MARQAEKWSYLTPLERKLFRQRIKSYDEIMDNINDVAIISCRYGLSVDGDQLKELI